MTIRRRRLTSKLCEVQQSASKKDAAAYRLAGIPPLNISTVGAESTEAGREFHSWTVLGKNECW